MRPRFRDFKFTVGAGGLIILALALLLLPLRWVFAWVTGILVHETGHLLAARLLGVRVLDVELGLRGARISTLPLEPAQELVCALSGPAAGFFLTLLGRWFPRLAVCAAVQTAYNLLPMSRLDGGRALRCLLTLMRIPGTDRLCDFAQWLLLAVIGLLGCYVGFALRFGLLPVLWAGSMIFRVCREKYLANGGI